MKRHYRKTTRNAIFNKYYKRAAHQSDKEISDDEDEHNRNVIEMYSTTIKEMKKSPVPSSSSDSAMENSGMAMNPSTAISKEDCFIGDSDHSTSNISSRSSVDFHVSDSDNFDESNIQEISSHVDSADSMTITSRLAEWALKHNITHIAINDLLTILKPSFTEIPLDARTLLKTPRNTILETVEPGSYYHFGFKKCLEKLFIHSCNLFQDFNLLEVCINIDGLPLSKSSGSQLYPILCNLFLNKNIVEIIGIYHGNEKPKDANNFLKFFVEESVDVLHNGIFFNDRLYQVRIKAFICDVPAKSYIKYVMGHSGYDSCSKCEIKGVYIERRVCFPDVENLTPRNDSDFRTKVYENHHSGTSVLEMIPGIDMIKDFPLDYMHLVCLGVVKKLIVNLWMHGKVPVKLFHQISNISKLLLSQSSNIPHEFNRKPRSLDEARRWKATEFRLFLFYLGPVILKKVLDSEKYLNFLSLHVSLSFLSNSQWQHNIVYCQSLLKYFVETFIILYGAQNVSHNVHNLLHLCDDVRRFGPLDMFSAFPFENHMKNLKKHIRKTDKPLQQIIRRIVEEENSNKLSKTVPHKKYPEPSNEHSNGPVLVDVTYSKQFKTLLFEHFSLSIFEPDNCCYLNDNSAAIIKNIFLTSNNEVKLLVQKILKLEDFYDSPCKSSELGIFLVSDFGLPELIHSRDISHKCMKLDFEEKKIMSGRTWTVIKFIDEDTVEAVPTTWLLENSCYWPPYPRDKLVAAIKNFEAPNTHWPSHKMEVFRNGTFDTYLEARRKSNVAEYMSDLNQEDEPQTRRVRHKKHVGSSSDDEAISTPKEKVFHKPPTRVMNESVEDDALSINRNVAVATTTKDPCCCCPIHMGIVRTDEEVKRIKKQYVFLTNIMADMKTDLSDIKSAISAKVQPLAAESIFLKFTFPVNDETSLQAVEDYLSVEENFQNTVPEIANLGGNTVYDCVKRAMTVLITNQFAGKYSFLGRKQKSSFSVLKMSNLVIKAALHSSKGDRKEVEEAVSKWLRRANERKGI